MPRAPEDTDCARTPTNVSGRAFRVNHHLAFCQKVPVPMMYSTKYDKITNTLHILANMYHEGTKARSEQNIRDEDGTLLRDKVRIRERWSRFYDKLGNTKSLKLDPTIIDLLPPRPLKLSLEDEPSMNEMTEALKGMPNWKPVGPDGLPSELLSRPPRIRSVLFTTSLSTFR